MTRSLVKLGALGALAMTVVAACSADESPTPKLRRGAPSTSKATTEPVGDASATTAPAPPPGSSAPVVEAGAPGSVETQLSDLDLEVVANGYGPLEKNTSNGELAAGDGKPITLGGVVYPKGLGIHASSEINVALGGNYKTFLADVGVDDEVADNGSIVFQVIADGETLFDSGVMTGASETKKVSVSIAGKQQLKLVVADGGDGIGSDHGDWAGARLVK